MGQGYEVDLLAMSESADGITHAVDTVSAHPVDATNASVTTLGHGRLAETLGDFAHRWQKGIENLTEDGRAIAAAVTAARDTYAATDADSGHRLDSVVRVDAGPDPAAH